MYRDEPGRSEQEAVHGLCCGPVESQPAENHVRDLDEQAEKPPFYLPCD